MSNERADNSIHDRPGASGRSGKSGWSGVSAAVDLAWVIGISY